MPFDPRFRPDVMLLAAGLGLRMRPLTDHAPKPLLKVAGTALIDRVIAAAAAEGCTHFVANAHYHREQLRAHLEALATGRPELRFRFSEEAELLDTGGGVKHALPLLETDPILVMNTDAFWPDTTKTPLARMLEVFGSGEADIVLLCVDPRRAKGFRRGHDFCRAPDGQLTRDRGEPVIYAGAALLRRGLIEAESMEKFSLYRSFVAALERQRLHGVMLGVPWLHVGDPAALAEAETQLGATVP